MTERKVIPWPDGPQHCHIDLDEDGHGHIHFTSPLGRPCYLPIRRAGTSGDKGWVWTDHGDGTGHLEPSILTRGWHYTNPDDPTEGFHYEYHSPFRTQWVITEATQ